MFNLLMIKCELIKQLDNLNVRRLLSQHGEDSVIYRLLMLILRLPVMIFHLRKFGFCCISFTKQCHPVFHLARVCQEYTLQHK